MNIYCILKKKEEVTFLPGVVLKTTSLCACTFLLTIFLDFQTLQLQAAKDQANMYLAKLKETESELGVMKERCTRQEGELVKKSCKYQTVFLTFYILYCSILS